MTCNCVVGDVKPYSLTPTSPTKPQPSTLDFHLQSCTGNGDDPADSTGILRGWNRCCGNSCRDGNKCCRLLQGMNVEMKHFTVMLPMLILQWQKIRHQPLKFHYHDNVYASDIITPCTSCGIV